MTIKELAYEIEDLGRMANKVNSFQLALYIAIYEGSADVEEYEGVFNAFGDLCFSLKNKIVDLEDRVFESLKKGNSGNE